MHKDRHKTDGPSLRELMQETHEELMQLQTLKYLYDELYSRLGSILNKF